MKTKIILALLFFVTSCASVPQKTRKISLSEIENLEIGNITSTQVVGRLGNPQEIIEKFKPNKVWIYGDQNVSLTFNEKSILIGGVWFAANKEDILPLQQVLTILKDAKFNIKKVGWDKLGHSYSDDLRYTSKENGISFDVNPRNNSVMIVSFSIPSARVPAGEKKKL